jgi:phosphosulfolactate phosphohydrolase-like enzyme
MIVAKVTVKQAEARVMKALDRIKTAEAVVDYAKASASDLGKEMTAISVAMRKEADQLEAMASKLS